MADAHKNQHHAIAIAVDKDGSQFTSGEWEVGLCGCFTHCVPNCLMVTYCPCISMAQISVRLGMMDYCCAIVTYVLLLVLTGGLGNWVWLFMARQETRKMFQIPGGCCGDYLATCCCGCCSLAQVATQIKSYEPGSCGFGPKDTLPPFVH